MPEEFKVPAFLKLLPKSHEADIKWNSASGLTDYHSRTESIIVHSQQLRLEGSFKSGDNDMDVSLVEQQLANASWEPWIAAAARSEV